jgi:hypothetical protein
VAANSKLKSVPARLYKYRTFNTNSLRLLTEAEIYYSDPNRFNDPMDCNPTVEIDVDREALQKLCYGYLCETRTHDNTMAVIKNCYYMSTEYGDYKQNDTYLKKLLAREIERCLYKEMSAKGVLSLSKTWKSPLMWSHYADEHRGFCIEYDTTQIAHPELAAVGYRSPRSVKTSDLIEWKLHRSSEARHRVHNTFFFAKAPEWKYEKEWRDIYPSSGAHDTGFMITAVYFGLRCDPAVMTSVVKLYSHDRRVQFFEIYPKDDSFGLKRRSIDPDEVEACGVRSSAILAFKDVILPEDQST